MTKKLKVFSDGKKVYYRSKNRIDFTKDLLQSNRVCKFNNKILHPEDKLARKPLIEWIEEINLSLRVISSKENLIEQIEKVAIIYNQATYIMAAAGDFRNAYKFCNHAILLFNFIFSDSNQADHLFYCIQPWINLIRLDRICAAEKDAIEKLEFLIQKSKQTSSINESIISKALHLNPPKNILEVIDNAYIFEMLKIFLQIKQYKKITDLKKYPNINKYHLSVIAESEIIASNNLKEFDKSLSIAISEYKNGQPIAMPVFLYRIMELISEEQVKEYKIIDTMIKYIQRKLKTNNYSLYDLIFMYEVYKYIFSYFDEYKDTELLLLFSSAFLKENDQPGRIDSIRLASLLDNKYLEDLNKLVKCSDYCFVNQDSYYFINKKGAYNRMLLKLESLHSYYI